jgi:ABC-type nitrate/sulfonate/bicarbonate transport system substrate-binding protein
VLHTAPQLAISSPLPGGAGFMSARFIQEHPQVARRFGEVLHKAIESIRSDEEFARKVLVKYTPLNENLAAKVRQPEYSSHMEMDATLLQREYDALAKAEILKGNVDVARMIYRPE